jgi:DNA-binding XRE family transcriptional regulator
MQAERLAAEVKGARAEHAMTLEQVARRADVSPDTVKRIEAADPHVQLDNLCAVGAAVNLDVVVRVYRARPPSLRDSGQLELARMVCAIAHPSWDPVLELSAGEHGKAIDIGFFGAREILDVEIDRLILDLQDQHRRNGLKRDFLAGRHQRPVRLVWVLEDTMRNRSAVAPHRSLIQAAFPAGSRDVLRALRTGEPLGEDGLLWLRRSRPPARGRPIDRRNPA